MLFDATQPDTRTSVPGASANTFTASVRNSEVAKMRLISHLNLKFKNMVIAAGLIVDQRYDDWQDLLKELVASMLSIGVNSSFGELLQRV